MTQNYKIPSKKIIQNWWWLQKANPFNKQKRKWHNKWEREKGRIVNFTNVHHCEYVIENRKSRRKSFQNIVFRNIFRWKSCFVYFISLLCEDCKDAMWRICGWIVYVCLDLFDLCRCIYHSYDANISGHWDWWAMLYSNILCFQLGHLTVKRIRFVSSCFSYSQNETSKRKRVWESKQWEQWEQ